MILGFSLQYGINFFCVLACMPLQPLYAAFYGSHKVSSSFIYLPLSSCTLWHFLLSFALRSWPYCWQVIHYLNTTRLLAFYLFPFLQRLCNRTGLSFWLMAYLTVAVRAQSYTKRVLEFQPCFSIRGLSIDIQYFLRKYLNWLFGLLKIIVEVIHTPSTYMMFSFSISPSSMFQ